MSSDNREDPMVYKTILVHCTDRQRLPRLLDPAVRLSAAFGAHLIGVSVSPPIIAIPAGMPGAPDTIVIDERAKAYRAENPAMQAVFQQAAAAQNITAEWREEDAGSGTVTRIVTRHACCADLVIASQAASDSNVASLDVPDRLAMESGRPVLIIPDGGSFQPIVDRVVVAWTARREATRAMFDALPLLKRADKVTVLEVDPEPVQEAMEYRTAACATLARHGVVCEAETAVSSDRNAGDALLAYCERTKANLLVMGCYGHSRMREFVLGGTSRRLLAGMTLPVLMSH
jgi:nucleotide-binding universal stress UspA family protein